MSREAAVAGPRPAEGCGSPASAVSRLLAIARCPARRRRAAALPALLALAALAPAASAHAHQASDAYLQASADPDGRLALRADVALRDLDVVLDLDADADGRLSWGEVRARQDDIAGYVAAHLPLRRPGGGDCPLAPAGFTLDRKADGTYAALRYRGGCTLADGPTLRYALLQGVDPTHRGLLRVQGGDGADAANLRSLVPCGAPVQLALPGAQGTAAEAGLGDDGAAAGGFFAEGLHHILIGADHVLFLVCLLLPLALGREADGAPRRGRALWGPLLALVTAFTVAHSITLGLAAGRVLSVSPRVIEPLIAATIALAAVDNLRPVLGRRRVLAAFFFGLVHGFGFAGPLLEVELPPWPMAQALLAFNLGVEAGQIAVVALALALLAPLRGRGAASGWLRGGSAAAGLIALVWLGERLLDVKLLPL